MPLAQDEHPVGDLDPGGEHEPFRVGVRARTPRRDLGADRRPSLLVRIGSPPGDQAAVPPQDGARGDESVRSQPCRQEWDQRAENRSSTQSSRGRGWVGRSMAISCRSTSSCVLGSGRAALDTAEQDQPATEPDEDEIEQAQGHG